MSDPDYEAPKSTQELPIIQRLSTLRNLVEKSIKDLSERLASLEAVARESNPVEAVRDE